MTKYHIERSIDVNATPSTVGEVIGDFRQWPAWSPWLIMDRDTELAYHGSPGEVGSRYDWSGELTGQGSMTVTSLNDHQIKMDLRFIKPFRSKAAASFDIETIGDKHSRVTWHMFGSVPFPISLLVMKSVKSGIAMDFTRGLRMLKEYLETGSVASSVQVEQNGLVEPSTYLAVAGTGNVNTNIEDVVQSCFDELMDYLVLYGIDTIGPSFVIYERFDVDSGHMSYLCAAPVNPNTAVPPTGPVLRGRLDAARAIKVHHTGSYQNLGNAWSTGMSYARYKKVRTKNVPTGIEIYRNGPQDTKPEDLETEVLLLRR